MSKKIKIYKDSETRIKYGGKFPKKRDFEFNINDNNSVMYNYIGKQNIVISGVVNQEDKKIKIDFLKNKVYSNEKRAPAGLTRKLLCNLFEWFLEKGYIRKKYTVSLYALPLDENYRSKKDITEMYKRMSFKAIREIPDGSTYMETTVRKFLNWCDMKYKK